MSSGDPHDDPEGEDGDDANFTWEAVDSDKKRFWKLDASYTMEDDADEFVPFPDLVRINDTYVQLKKKDIEGNSMRDTRTREPLGAVYISNTCFSKLKKEKNSGDFDFGSGVPIRTREGTPAFAEAVKTATRGRDPEKTTESLAWNILFDNGVKADSQYISLRFVNPNIDVMLRSLGTMVAASELKTIVDANKDVTKQNVTVSLDTPASLTSKGFILVCSP
jgi:hypothetical protein